VRIAEVVIETLPRELPPRGRALAWLHKAREHVSRANVRWLRDRLALYGRTALPPPAKELAAERVAYGMAQPLLGFRVLLSDRELLREALVPAAWLAAFCGIVALARPAAGPLWLGRLTTFYRTFALLAPVPSVLFARHYARLAALVRWRLGFAPYDPREYPIAVSFKRAVQQSIVVAIGLLPLVLVSEVIPLLGKPIAQLVLGVWAVHWVVVDAFDDARVLLPGETVRSAEEADRLADSPWYVRGFRKLADRMDFPIVSRLLRSFARLCDRLSLPWRGELALMEANPSLATGFAIATASLLAVPGLNLLFRPIILVASSHLLGHLEAHDPMQHPELSAEPELRPPGLPGR
jgi:uncharacterized protein involved in cysteine biosynthesis